MVSSGRSFDPGLAYCNTQCDKHNHADRTSNDDWRSVKFGRIFSIRFRQLGILRHVECRMIAANILWRVSTKRLRILRRDILALGWIKQREYPQNQTCKRG